MRVGCAVPAPAVGRAWLLLCPSREGARGVSVTSGQQGLMFVIEGARRRWRISVHGVFSKVLRWCLESESALDAFGGIALQHATPYAKMRRVTPVVYQTTSRLGP
jgi:hypothetical protein